MTVGPDGIERFIDEQNRSAIELSSDIAAAIRVLGSTLEHILSMSDWAGALTGGDRPTTASGSSRWPQASGGSRCRSCATSSTWWSVSRRRLGSTWRCAGTRAPAVASRPRGWGARRWRVSPTRGSSSGRPRIASGRAAGNGRSCRRCDTPARARPGGSTIWRCQGHREVGGQQETAWSRPARGERRLS